MGNTIAVMTDDSGCTSAFLEGTLIKIFEQNSGKWTQTGSITFQINRQSGIKEIRQILLQTEHSLSLLFGKDSKILVGSSVAGLPYNIFDAADYTIFEIEGKPEEFIEKLGTQIEAHKTKGGSSGTVVYSDHPVDSGDGRYYFDLYTLQIKKPGVTSKQVLMPFFTEKPFMSLEIVCAHIPQWFDREFERLGLVYTANKSGNGMLVTVTHKVCDGCE